IHTAVVGDEDAVAVFGIDPDVVGIAAPGLVAEAFAAVGGEPEGGVGDEDLVGVGGRDVEVDVVAGAADEGALPVGDGPVLAAVIGAPDGALVGSLDEGVDALGIAGSDFDVDLADGRVGHAVDGALPIGAAIVGDEDAAARSAAVHTVGVHGDFPSAGDEVV